MTKIEVLQICALAGCLVGLGVCLAIEAWLLWQLRGWRRENESIRAAAEQLRVDMTDDRER